MPAVKIIHIVAAAPIPARSLFIAKKGSSFCDDV